MVNNAEGRFGCRYEAKSLALETRAKTARRCLSMTWRPASRHLAVLHLWSITRGNEFASTRLLLAWIRDSSRNHSKTCRQIWMFVERKKEMMTHTHTHTRRIMSSGVNCHLFLLFMRCDLISWSSLKSDIQERLQVTLGLNLYRQPLKHLWNALCFFFVFRTHTHTHTHSCSPSAFFRASWFVLCSFSRIALSSERMENHLWANWKFLAYIRLCVRDTLYSFRYALQKKRQSWEKFKFQTRNFQQEVLALIRGNVVFLYPPSSVTSLTSLFCILTVFPGCTSLFIILFHVVVILDFTWATPSSSILLCLFIYFDPRRPRYFSDVYRKKISLHTRPKCRRFIMLSYFTLPIHIVLFKRYSMTSVLLKDTSTRAGIEPPTPRVKDGPATHWPTVETLPTPPLPPSAWWIVEVSMVEYADYQLFTHCHTPWMFM